MDGLNQLALRLPWPLAWALIATAALLLAARPGRAWRLGGALVGGLLAALLLGTWSPHLGLPRVEQWLGLGPAHGLSLLGGVLMGAGLRRSSGSAAELALTAGVALLVVAGSLWALGVT